jgi:glycosyltransferase involved in cell wall biosynthesis
MTAARRGAGRGEPRFDVTFYAPWVAPLLRAGDERSTGGSETQILLIARGLAERGAQVAMIVVEIGPALPRSVDGIAIVPLRLPATRSLGRLVALLRAAPSVLQTIRGSRVVVQRAAGFEVGVLALVARLMRRRFVYSTASIADFDDESRQDARRLRVVLFRLGLRLSSHIVVQSGEQAELCRTRLERPCTVIRSIAEPGPAVADGRVLLWVGRLADYKRPEDFLALAETLPEFELWMVGAPQGGSEALEARLRARAAELPNVRLLDPRPREQLLDLIAHAGAMVHTGDFEGMPNVLLEGWARGVPALTLRFDPDGVIEREGLGSFAHGDLIVLAEQARHLVSDRDLHADVAQRCRAYVARHHDREAVLDQWESVVGLPTGLRAIRHVA